MHQQKKARLIRIMFIRISIILCITFCTTKIYSINQNAKSIASQSFFPLQVGNKWIFQRNELAPYNTYFTLSIIDTARYDDELYWEFSPFLFNGKQYYRIDSTGNFKQLNNEKPILNFNMHAGDSIPISYYPEYLDSGYTYCVKRESVTTFTGTQGEQIEYFIDWSKRVIDEADVIILHEGVGPVGLSFTEHDSPMILRGTLINGVIYGDTTTTSVKDERAKSITGYYIYQNYPNPFNSSTVIKYSLTENSNVSLKIYDLNGRLVEEIILNNQEQGAHEFRWTPQSLTSGVYLLKIQTQNWQRTIKAILLK